MVLFGSILFFTVSVMGYYCKAKKNCMQSTIGPADLYSNGVMNPHYMWYRVRDKVQVPVVVDPNYSYKERRIILGGLYEIQYKTCISFYIFNTTQVLDGYDYVYITKGRKGCWSHIGRVGGGVQELSLGKGCVNHRTAVHEMIHALGFAHEHVRSDRDNYVYIFWKNISPGRESNFAKRDTKSTDPYGPYDYASIMHYDRTAFSANEMDTIKPLKLGAKIGVGKTMSAWDVKKLRRMYDCAGHGRTGGSTGIGGFNGGGSLAYDAVSNFIDNHLRDDEDLESGHESDDSDDLEGNTGPQHQPTSSTLEVNRYQRHHGTRTLDPMSPLTSRNERHFESSPPYYSYFHRFF